MTYALRLLACIALSALVHLLLADGVEHLPPLPPAPVNRVVTVRVTAPEPPPEPEKPPPAPEPTKAPPTRPVKAPPQRRLPVHVHAQAPSLEPPPPTERPAASGPTSGAPVFGVSMESTSQGGSGPALPVGNTLQVDPKTPREAPAGPVRPLPAPPVEDYQVTKMPLPHGRCSGKYTEAARAAGVEGVVVLDLVVGQNGRARQIKVVQGLSHGLDQAAITALRACRFSPGERDGKPVAVRIRTFKIRFVLQDAE